MKQACSLRCKIGGIEPRAVPLGWYEAGRWPVGSHSKPAVLGTLLALIWWNGQARADGEQAGSRRVCAASAGAENQTAPILTDGPSQADGRRFQNAGRSRATS